MSLRPLPLLSALLLILTACAPVYSARELKFTASAPGQPIDPRTLLTLQQVPADRLLSVPEALARAPLGSAMIVCWKSTRYDNPWGPCSHMTRKISDTTITESSGLVKGGINFLPLDQMNERYAVIVLDTPVTEAQLAAMNAEATRLRGLPYDLSGEPNTYYCTTYQNQLQVSAGLPPLMPLNQKWNAYVPADALQQPGVGVLWVGINEQAKR